MLAMPHNKSTDDATTGIMSPNKNRKTMEHELLQSEYNAYLYDIFMLSTQVNIKLFVITFAMENHPENNCFPL